MRHKRMLFDAEGVPVGRAVRAGLCPIFHLPMETGALEAPVASLVICFWEQQVGASCPQDVAGCGCFVRSRKTFSPRHAQSLAVSLSCFPCLTGCEWFYAKVPFILGAPEASIVPRFG